MATAFIKNSEVLQIFDGNIPSDFDLAPGVRFCGSPNIGWTDGTYAVVSADYVDSAPADDYTATGPDLANSTVNAGPPVTVSAKRTWQKLAQPTQLSPLEFRNRFSAQEQSAILTAALTNATLLGILLAQASAQYIDLGDSQTIAGVSALVASGLITQDRATAILTP